MEAEDRTHWYVLTSPLRRNNPTSTFNEEVLPLVAGFSSLSWDECCCLRNRNEAATIRLFKVRPCPELLSVCCIAADAIILHGPLRRCVGGSMVLRLARCTCRERRGQSRFDVAGGMQLSQRLRERHYSLPWCRSSSLRLLVMCTKDAAIESQLPQKCELSNLEGTVYPAEVNPVRAFHNHHLKKFVAWSVSLVLYAE